MAEHPKPHPDLAGYVLGVLTPAEGERFEQHLGTCEGCGTEVSELRVLRPLLEAVAEEPPDELRERTLGAVEEAARGERKGMRAAVPGGTRAAGPDSRGDERGARWTAVRWAVRWARDARLRPVAVVATVVLLAVLGAVTLAGRDEGPRTVTVPLTAVAGGRGGGEARITRSPDGLAIRMSVSGLPPNPPGTYYECWYVSDRDSPLRPQRVSGGTFAVGKDGAANVGLTTAADFRKYPRIAVTLESDDGDPGTTGRVVLVSTRR